MNAFPSSQLRAITRRLMSLITFPFFPDLFMVGMVMLPLKQIPRRKIKHLLPALRGYG
jgi:hypothetical protein